MRNAPDPLPPDVLEAIYGLPPAPDGPAPEGASFTCPRCSRTSWNPFDVAERYCGACHWWTGR